jgi:hypothetical protein
VGTVNPNLPAPASNQVTGGQTCGIGTVPLTASCSTGQKPQWYNNNINTGVALFEGNTFITASISVTTTYYVGCKDNNTGCETLPANRRGVIATYIKEVDNGGQVAKSQVYCGPSQPAPFTSIVPATGSSTTVEYLWLTNKNTTDTVFTPANESLWVQVAGATSATFAPPFANATIAYIRCARSAGCEFYTAESNVVVIKINPIPATPADPTINKSAICIGESVSLSATCGTSETAQWYEGTMAIGTGNFTYTPTVLGAHTYTVGCKNNTTNCETAAVDRGKVYLQVNPIPATPANPTINKSAICIGETVNLSATCGTNETAQWYEGTTAIGTGNFTYTPTVLGAHTYTVGCKNNSTNCETAAADRGKVLLQVNPIPNTPTNPTVNKGDICLGETVSLSATCGTNETAQWYEGTTFLGAGNITYTPTVLGSHTYTVGCKNNATLCETAAVNRGKVLLKVNGIPAIPTSVVSASRCDAGIVKLTASCETGATPVWYSTGTSVSYIASGTSFSPDISVTNSYTVGCRSLTVPTYCETPAGSRVPVVGTVNPNLPAPSSVTPGLSCQVNPPAFTIVVLSATCSTGQTQQWYTQAGVFAGTGSPFNANILATSTFTVGCKDDNTGCETLPANRKPVVATVIINVTNGGQIAANQSNCGPFVPAKLTSVVLPSGGNSTVEYMWLKNLSGSTVYDPNDHLNWISASIVSGEGMSADFQPGNITKTTSFIRCSRSAGCVDFIGESNIVVITINPIPVTPANPTISKSAICIGESVSLSASCGTNETAQWYEGTTAIGTGNFTYTPTVLGAHTYTVGCKDNTTNCETAAADRGKVTLQVNPIPAMPANPMISKSAICIGESVSLSATCGTNETAQWYEGTTAIGTGNFTYTPTVLGAHTYTVGCKNNSTNCETAAADRGKITLQVNPIPATPANLTISKGDICLGETVSLSATCGTNETAQWYEATTFLGAGNITYTPTVLGAHTYTVGCKNNATLCETAAANRGKVTLQINEIPAAPTSATGGAVCGSGSINLTATCATGTIAVWYNTQNATTSLSVGNTFNVAVTANKTYYVACRSTTSPTFCESPASSRKAVDVIFNNNPVPTVSATPNAICVGGSTNLKVNETFATYAWKGPNGFANSNQSVDITNIVTANAGVYTVTVSAAGGCTASATVNVTVNTNPSVTASVTDNTVCQQSTIELRSSATAGTGTISSYAWTGPNTYTAVIQNPDIVTATSAMTGAYVVKVTDINGCTATSQISVIINPLPTATASSEGGNTICLGAPISFVASGAGIGGSYQWTGPAGSGFSETTQSPTIVSTTLANAGVYTLKITNSNGCTAITTINITIDKCLRIGNLVWEDTNNNGIVDGTETGVTTPVKVELYKANLDGTLGAFVTTQNTVAGKYLFSGLEPGDYIVQITAPTGYKSSTGTNGSATGAYELAPDPDNDKDNDDNGSFESGQIIRSKPVTLQNFNEPTNDGDDNNGNLTVDFGLYKPGSIGDFVFNDDNRNGQQDATETGVAGVTVNLYDSSSATIPVATATTDANGKYLFDNLKPDTYVVEFVKSTLPNDKQFTTKNTGATATDSDANIGTGKSDPIILGIAETNLTIDAGIQCPLPTPTATTTTTQVCVGGVIKLTATGGKAYSWKGPNGFSETTADVTINNAIIANTGTYTVTVTADNKCNATAIATVAVTVNPNPSVSATGAVVCTEETINLKAQGSGIFSWKGPNSFSRTEQNPVITGATALNAGVYTVTVTNGSSCNVSTTVNVTVNTRPAAPTETNKNKSNICDGETLSLSGVCATGTTIKWYKADGVTELIPSQNFNPGPVGTYVYYAVCKNDVTKCETFDNLKAKVTVIVDKIPDGVTPTLTKGAICLGETVNLSATCGTNQAPVWYFGTPTTLYTGSLTLTPAIGTYKYYVSCKSTVGAYCETPSDKRLSVTLTVKANPVATASVKDNTVCTGSTIELLGGEDNLTYSWSGPGFTSTLQNPTIANAVTTNSGVYTLTVTNGGSCTASAVVSVSVLINPIATASGNAICANETVKLASGAVLAGTGNSVSTYAWTGPNGFTDSIQNPTIINAQPNRTGVYTVLITDANGCTATATAGVTVNILLTATASSNSPVCLNSKLTLEVISNATSYAWTGPAGSGFTSSVQKPEIASVTAANAGIYTVVVTNSNSCTATATVNIIVNPLPTVSATGAIVCATETLNLKSSGTGSFVWSGPGSPAFSSTQQNPSITNVAAINAGVYTVVITNGNQCSALATANVIVNPLPVPPTTPTVSKGVICLGETIMLSGSCSTGQTAKWYDGAGVSITNLIFAPASVGTFNYYVGCKDDVTGCETGANSRAKVTVIVDKIPGGVTPTLTKGSICLGETVSLSATCGTNEEPVWYLGTPTTLYTGSLTLTPAVGTYKYYVSCKSKTGAYCETAAPNRKSVTLTVKDNPTATASAKDNTVCTGSTVELLGGVDGLSSYSWTGPASFTSSLQNPTIPNAIGANTGNYVITVTNGGNCSATAVVSVTILVNPVATASGNVICANETVLLKSGAVLAGTGNSVATYAWSGPNGFTDSVQNPTIPNAQPERTGTYTVLITDSNGGCTATATTTIAVYALPTATASSNSPVCTGATLNLKATGGIGYQWSGPGGFNRTEAEPSLTILNDNSQAGIYTVTVTNKTGCTATATTLVVIQKCLRLGDYVWNDVNNNGKVDAGETGIDGVKVELFKANASGVIVGAAIATQNTVAGKYLFSGLDPDNYIVQITAPAGYKSSTGTNGSATGAYEPATDPDATVVNNEDRGTTVTVQLIQSKAITLTNLGEPDVAVDGDDTNGNLTVDFGLYKPGSLGDFVFNDDNRNGQQDATETGVAGVTVNLYDSSSATIPVATVTTDANGKYLFDNLKPDTYVVEFVKSTLPNDKQFTTQNVNPDATDSDANVGTGKSDPIILGIGETNLTIDAGIQCPLPTVAATTTTPKVCVGGTILLKSTVTTTPGVKAYSWSGPGFSGATTADVSIANAVLANSGAYTVTVTANSICLATASSTVAVIVNPNPTAKATGATVCEGETITLTGEGNGTYAWTKVGGTFTSTEATPTVTTNALTTDAGVYQLIVKTGESCTAIATTTVVVNTRPAAPTETNKNKSNICDGETLSLSGVCATGTTIKWYKADGVTELNPSQNFNPGPVGTYVYYAVCKNDLTSCETTNNLRAKVTVIVDKIPDGVTPTLTKGSICLGETVSLSATCGTNQAPVWYFGTPTTLYTGSLTLTPAIGTYKYYVSCKSTVGAYCETPSDKRLSVTLTVKANPVATASVKDNTVCTGSTIELLGGEDNLTYSWSGPGFTSTLQNPTIANAVSTNAGNYTLTVTNGGSCTASAVVSVSVLVNPIVTASGNVICANETVLLKSGAVLAGTGNSLASYAWSGPLSFTSSVQNPTIPNAQPNRTGIYTVLITDANGCTATATAGVTVNILLTATASSNSPVCSGNELRLSATSSTGVSYSWSAGNGFTGSTLREPSISQATLANSGTYTVKVTDINGCTAIATTSAVINPLPTATATSNSPVCLNNKLTLEVASNGTSYAWTGPAGSGFTSTSQKPEIASAVAANGGVYTVVVTNGNSCSITSTVNVVVNPLPTTAATGAEVCVGKPITLDATAGFIAYAWTKVGGTFTASTQSPSVTTSAVTTDAGIYQVLVTNKNGCTAIATATVIVNELPVPTAQNNGPVCVGTTITLTANAGFTKYAWSASNGFTASTAVATIPNAVTTDALIYTVTVTNTKGCIATATTEVKVNTNPNPTIQPIPAVCLGDNVVLNVSGNGTDTYSWKGSNGFTSSVQNPTDKPTAFGTVTYTVTVTGVGGCTGTAMVAVIVNPLPNATASSNSPVCAGLPINLIAGGGTKYSWKGPDNFTSTQAQPIITASALKTGTYTVTVTSSDNCTQTATTAVLVNAVPTVTVTNVKVCSGNDVNLVANTIATKFSWTSATTFTSSVQSPTILKATLANAGTYTVKVEDINGCTATASATVTIDALPTATATSNSPVCLTNKLTLEVLTSGDSYSWTGPAGSGFTSTSQKPEIASAVAANGGVYTVVVSNGNNCSATATVNVVVNPLPTTAATGAEVCIGKPITLDATAGFTKYAWTKVGGTFTASTQLPVVTTSAVTTDAGIYQVLVTKANGCTAIATATVIVNELPVPTAQNNGPVCVGTTITLTANAGFTKYAWVDSKNAFVGSTAVVTIPNAVTGNAGIYTVTVTNAKGCIATATTEVKINTNPNPTIQPIAPICSGENIVLNVSGGANDKYSWTSSNGFTSTQQNPTVSPKPTTAGIYTYFVTVEGVGGCTGTATTSVTIKALPTVTVPSISICAGVTGKLTASGATTYAWSSNTGETFTSTTADLSVTKAGIYTVIGTTAGCTAVATTSVEVKVLPTVTVQPIAICTGVTGTLTANGATTYSWSSSTGETFTSTTATLSVTKAGIYTVIGTNAGGCTASATTTVTVHTNPNPVATSNTTICLKETVTLGITGATAGNTYAWIGSNGFASTVQSPSDIPTGSGTVTYTVTVTGVGGCTGTATTSVIVKPNPVVTLSSTTICAGLTGTITASGADSYAWTGPGTFTTTSANLSVTTAGTYSVTGTTNGCTATATATVVVNAVPTVTVANITVCAGNDVTFDVKTNATKSFSWTSSTTPKFTSSTQNPTILKATIAATGTYTVTVENTNGCTALATAIVTVNPLPTATASSNSPVCLGSPINLTSSGSGTDFAWVGSNNFTSSVQNPSVTPLPTTAGTYTYLVTVKNGNQCSATATVSVVVNALPTATATGTAVCVGQPIVISVSPAFSSYSWTKDNVFKSSSQNPTISASAVSGDAGTYKVLVTDVNGCTAIATTSVIVNELPVPTATNTGPVCVGTSVTVKAIGGTNYSWKDNTGAFIGATADVIIPNAVTGNAGIYTVTVTNVNGCVGTATTEVKVNTNPNPTITPIVAICLGTSYQLNVSGITGNTYAWSGSGFTSTEQNPTVTPTPTTAGTYTYFVTVQGVGGCTAAIATTNVTVKPLPTATATSDVTCTGGIIKLTATGNGTFNWTGKNNFSATGAVVTIPDASVDNAGIYTVTITNNGCTATATTIVTVQPVILIPPSVYAICKSSTATIETNFTATGTNWLWTPNGETTPTIAVSTAGTYNVSFNDKVKGCKYIATFTVEVNDKSNPVITPIAPVCSGQPIVLNVSGVTGNKFTWSGSGFTSTVQNPTVTPTPTTAGVYTYAVLVEGTGGCTGTATTSVTVKANPTITVPTVAICAGTTGTLTASGADSYSWTGSGFTATGATVSITDAGTYSVIGTTNGCTATATTSVTVKAIPTVTLTPITLCAGVSGKLKAEGSAVDTYSWSSSNAGFSATTQEVAVSQAGTYIVLITKDGCTAQATTTVEVKPSITLTVSTASICAGTTGTLTASGADTYSWTGSGFTATGATVSITNSGTYTVIGTSGNCTASATTTVTVKATPTVTVPTASICARTTGTLTASGADSYSWSGSGFTATGATVSVTSAGTYSVIGTTNGCTATATTSVTLKPNADIKANSTEVCTGGTTTLTATGGATYSWTGSGFTATGAIISVNVAGTYTVVGTTAEGCTGTATATLTVKDNPIVNIAGTTSKCAGTKATLTASGTGTFSWTGTDNFTSTSATVSVGAGTYQVAVVNAGCSAIGTVTVTEKATPTVTVPSITICTGTTGTLTASAADSYAWSGPSGFTGTTQAVTVKDKGTYTVTITSGGCTAVATTTVDEKPTVDIKVTSVEVCTGGTTTLTATGGVTYAWTGPGLFTETGASPTVSVAGTYTVTGTTEGGCIGTATATLTIKDNPTVIITGNTIICSGGKTTLTASGTGTFTWTGTDSFTATTAIVDVSAGTYQVTVTNAGCSAVGTIKIVNDNLSITAGGATVCEGGSTGLTGGATVTLGIQSYTWSGPNGFTSSELSPSVSKPTATGTYTLTVTSKAGCTATATAIITVTPVVTNTANVTFCKGGKATLTATGGTGATYLWTGGATTSSIEVTTAGTYDVRITDATGCISKGIFTVTESAAASATITGITSLCTSTSTKLTVNEGTTGETYTWTGVGGFTSTSQIITVGTSGDYAVLVKTQQGCEGTAKVTVTAGFTPTAVCGPVCEGDSIRFSATQLKGLTYSWSKNGTFISSSADPKLLNVQKSDAGVYEVVITGGGCTATVVATLIVYEKPTGITAMAQNSTCDQDTPKNDGAVKLAGIFTGLKYDIIEGATYTGTKKYADATDIPANGIVKSGIANPATNAGAKYTVRVFNANNCYADYTVTIQQVVCSCGEAKCVPYGIIKTKSGKK